MPSRRRAPHALPGQVLLHFLAPTALLAHAPCARLVRIHSCHPTQSGSAARAVPAPRGCIGCPGTALPDLPLPYYHAAVPPSRWGAACGAPKPTRCACISTYIVSKTCRGEASGKGIRHLGGRAGCEGGGGWEVHPAPSIGAGRAHGTGHVNRTLAAIHAGHAGSPPLQRP